MSAPAVIPKPAVAAARSPRASLAAARRKLNAAQLAVSDPSVSIFDVRHAHVMVTGAAQLLQQHLDGRAAADAEAHRRNATALARGLRDARVACEALRLTEHDLYPADGYLFVANGKNSKSRQVFVDDWVWPLLQPWLTFRQAYPPGPLFCVLEGPTAGRRPWGGASVRLNLKQLAELAGIRHRVAPHQWRHAMTVEQYEEGVDILVISRNLGHSSLAVTNTYLEGFPQSRVIAELRGRPVPKVSMFDMLRSEGLAVGGRADHRQALAEIPVPTVRDGAGRAVTPDLMGVLGNA